VATRKQKEIAELLRREISSIILSGLSDPRMGFVTLTRVHVAGDYRSAKVYLTVRGTEVDARKSLAALAHAHGHIQGLIADRIKLRWTPVLEFVEDKELSQALRVSKLMDRVTMERAESIPATGSSEDGSHSAGSEEKA